MLERGNRMGHRS